MRYCYPAVGNAGLGNMLFPWARCVLWSQANHISMLAPTWYRIRIGPYLRRELDKRQYQKLFVNDYYVAGIKKVIALTTYERVDEKQSEFFLGKQRAVIIFSGMQNKFDSLIGHHVQISNELKRIIKPLYLKPAWPFTQYIGIHIRRGDFAIASAADNEKMLRQGVNNQLIPLEWYMMALHKVREALGNNYPAVIFSDGQQQELEPILTLPNVALSQGNASITDIWGLAGSQVLIGSASSFSRWSSYLGQVPTIWYPGQKQYQLTMEPWKEIELDYDEPLATLFATKLMEQVAERQ